ncbi:MAG: hypothetical protein HYY85_12140 [Deltaproteobacteria bacterium]|nr:hypothetical protein [Deltaproteobacteria bacterium]
MRRFVLFPQLLQLPAKPQMPLGNDADLASKSLGHYIEMSPRFFEPLVQERRELPIH